MVFPLFLAVCAWAGVSTSTIGGKITLFIVASWAVVQILRSVFPSGQVDGLLILTTGAVAAGGSAVIGSAVTTNDLTRRRLQASLWSLFTLVMGVAFAVAFAFFIWDNGLIRRSAQRMDHIMFSIAIGLQIAIGSGSLVSGDSSRRRMLLYSGIAILGLAVLVAIGQLLYAWSIFGAIGVSYIVNVSIPVIGFQLLCSCVSILTLLAIELCGRSLGIDRVDRKSHAES